MKELEARLTDALVGNGHAVLNYFERRVDRDDAPDLLADVMLVAWRRVESMPSDEQQARMWLFGVARNVLLDHRRAGRRRSRLADRLRAVTSRTELDVPAVDAGYEVLDAVLRLPPDSREIVTLVHWDGFTLAEAGVLMGINASTVRGRYQRARAQLRRDLISQSA